MARAMTSLPVPVSPRIRTGQSTAATLLTSSKTALNFGLDPISSDVDIGSLLAPPLLRNPLADEKGTVSKFGAARFDERQQSDGIAVDEKQISEVQGDDSWFLLEERPEHGGILRCESTAYPDGHNVSFAHQWVDSAGHVHLSSRLSRGMRGRHRRRKRRTTHHGQKMAQTSECRVCEAGESE